MIGSADRIGTGSVSYYGQYGHSIASMSLVSTTLRLTSAGTLEERDLVIACAGRPVFESHESRPPRIQSQLLVSPVPVSRPVPNGFFLGSVGRKGCGRIPEDCRKPLEGCHSTRECLTNSNRSS